MQQPTSPYGAGRPAAALPVKTERGVEEIRRRSRTLSQRHRTVLLLIDGRRTLSEIRHVATQVGASDTCFDELLDLGLVSLPEPEPPAPPPAPPEQVPLAPYTLTDPGTDPDPEPEPEPAPEPQVIDAEPEPIAAEADPERVVPMGLVFTEPFPETVQTAPAPPYAVAPLDLSDLSDFAQDAVVVDSYDVESSPDELMGDIFPDVETGAAPAPDSAARSDAFDSGAEFGHSTRSTTGATGWLDSVKSSLLPLFESAFGPLEPDAMPPVTEDDPLEEARRILMRELREKAPVTGSLTLLKVRKARTRSEMAALLDSVGFHIGQPSRHLSAQQVVMRVRAILDNPPGPS